MRLLENALCSVGRDVDIVIYAVGKKHALLGTGLSIF